MKTLEMEIAIPKVKGGRCVSAEMKDGYVLAKFEVEENETSPISEIEEKESSHIFEVKESEISSVSDSKLECRIDPNSFAGAWLEHKQTTIRQDETLCLYQYAKAKGRLHTFSCMTIDASVKDGKLVYQKGLPIKTGFSQNQWAKMLKDYNPSRNSRQMTRTEYACRNLFLIQRLVESGYKIDEAWKAVCDDSRKIGHYRNSYNHKDDFELTGSREVCGFCDLGNSWKFLAEDPWETYGGFWSGGFWSGGGYYCDNSSKYPVANLDHYNKVNDKDDYGVGMLAMD